MLGLLKKRKGGEGWIFLLCCLLPKNILRWSHVVMKSLNRVNNFLTYSTMAAEYTTMYKDQQIPNDTTTNETDYVIIEQ